MSKEAKIIAINILKALNLLGIILLIVLTFVILSRIAAQAKINHDDTQESTDRIEADLGCLGRFFSQTNRTSLKIKDLSTCTIVNTATGRTTILRSGHDLNTNGSSQLSPPTTPAVAKTQAAQTVVPEASAIPPSKPTTTSAPPNPTPSNVLQPAINVLTKPVSGLVSSP